MASRFYPVPVQISATVEFEIMPPKAGPRTGLVVQNQSGFDIYLNEDTHADSNATRVQGGTAAIFDRNTGVPQGKVWLKGSQAALQNVLVKQAVDV